MAAKPLSATATAKLRDLLTGEETEAELRGVGAQIG
jgi:hypothetical protein